MKPEDVLAEGTYCTRCGFFEDEDLPAEGQRCMACGCHGAEHVQSKVVRA